MARTRGKPTQVALPSPGYGQGRQMAAIQQVGGGIGVRQNPVPGQPADRLADAAGGGGIGELSSVFGPTQRPGEPITAGVPIGPGPGPEVDPADPSILLAAMWSILPNPAIARLMRSDLG